VDVDSDIEEETGPVNARENDEEECKCWMS
jgi:hypothetical protein